MTETHPHSPPRLAGKTALITGGTTGIGRATAELFHREGAHVIVTGHDPASLEKARQELPNDIDVIRADARSVADAARLAETLARRDGGLDAVFLNAGVARLAPLEAVTEAAYDDEMNTNVKGVIFTLQKLLPLLNRGSSVMITTSVASQRGAPGMAVYAASKGAVASLTRTLAVELADRGVRVNVICPAPIHTEIQRKFGLPEDALGQLEQDFALRIPLRRFGRSDEVAEIALFLASDASSFVTGAEIPADGGLLVA